MIVWKNERDFKCCDAVQGARNALRETVQSGKASVSVPRNIAMRTTGKSSGGAR